MKLGKYEWKPQTYLTQSCYMFHSQKMYTTNIKIVMLDEKKTPI